MVGEDAKRSLRGKNIEKFRGDLFEIEVPQAHRVKIFIYQVVNFFLGFGLVEGTGGTRGREPGGTGCGRGIYLRA